jgi:phospholipase/carboxylesterase
MISRQNFLKLAGGAAGAASVGLFTACSCGREGETTPSSSVPDEETSTERQQQSGGKAERSRLLVRPGAPDSKTAAVSIDLQPAGPRLRARRPPLRPRGYAATKEAPLALTLHGSMGDVQSGFAPFLDLVDEASLVLLAPESRNRRNWDFLIPGYFGPDVEFIDRALEQTFERLAVDAERLTIEGFSDGASYAL